MATWSMRRRLGLALAGLILAAVGSTAAAAHAVLLEASPADGSHLTEPPTELVLRFNEPVKPIAVRLLDAQGAELAATMVEAQGETVVVRPTGALPRGAYFLSYRVASLDAHAVAATLRFGVGVNATAADVATDDVAARLAVFGRWLFYVTALGAVGATLFDLLVRPPPPLSIRVQRLAGGLAACGVAALAVRLGTAGLDLDALPITALTSPAPWAAAAGTTLGPAAGLALVGLLGITGRHRLPPVGRIASTVAVIASFTLTGHAATAEPRWLTLPAVGLHVLCAAFWLGAFVPLFWSLSGPQAPAVLRRFSSLALPAIALLAAAGGMLAWVQLGGNLDALTASAYGWRLLGKLALVAAMLALAAANRLLLTPALADGAPGSAGRLRRSFGADLVLGLGVLAVTATFPLSPPPRALVALEAADSTALTLVIAAPGGQATLTLLPGRAGVNRLEAWITDGNGMPVEAREGSVAWSLPAAGIERAQAALALPAPGVATARGIALPRGGRWLLRLELLIDDFTKLTFEGRIDVS
jgi:copper transport protein